MAKRICPNCGSEEVSPAGNNWECQVCGFSSKVFPEEKFIGEDDEEESEFTDEENMIIKSKIRSKTAKVTKTKKTKGKTKKVKK